MPLALSWTNQDIELFHGTIVRHAEEINSSGVDVNRSRPDCDFGTGFYCTTSLEQAQARAEQKAAATRQLPAVVGIILRRNDIAALNILAFVRGEREATDFWSLVHFFRDGNARRAGVSIGPLFPYDVVFGPVALWRSKRPMPFADQVSFHTQAAQQLLNLASTRSIIEP
jgi:hypothetical protein